MIGSLATRWLLTVVFVAAALAVVVAQQPRRRLAGPAGLAGHRPVRTGSAGLGGVAGLARPAQWPVAAFCPLMCAAMIAMAWWAEPLAAAWPQAVVFGGTATWFATAGAVQARRAPRAGLPGLHHGLMAGAMIWMLGAMRASAAMPSAMPGGDTMAGMAHPGLSAPMTAAGVLLAAYFALATVPWLMRALGRRAGVSNLAPAGQAAMSADLAAMLIVML